MNSSKLSGNGSSNSGCLMGAPAPLMLNGGGGGGLGRSAGLMHSHSSSSSTLLMMNGGGRSGSSSCPFPPSTNTTITTKNNNSSSNNSRLPIDVSKLFLLPSLIDWIGIWTPHLQMPFVFVYLACRSLLIWLNRAFGEVHLWSVRIKNLGASDRRVTLAYRNDEV